MGFGGGGIDLGSFFAGMQFAAQAGGAAAGGAAGARGRGLAAPPATPKSNWDKVADLQSSVFKYVFANPGNTIKGVLTLGIVARMGQMNQIAANTAGAGVHLSAAAENLAKAASTISVIVDNSATLLHNIKPEYLLVGAAVVTGLAMGGAYVYKNTKALIGPSEPSAPKPAVQTAPPRGQPAQTGGRTVTLGELLAMQQAARQRQAEQAGQPPATPGNESDDE